MTITIDTDSLPDIGEDFQLGSVVQEFVDEYLNESLSAKTVRLVVFLYCSRGEFAAAAKILEMGVDAFPLDHRLLLFRAKLLSRCPDATYLDGKAALLDAARALGLARQDDGFAGRSYYECEYLETLAAAQALVGDLQLAENTLAEATQMAKTNTWTKRLKKSSVQLEDGNLLIDPNWARIAQRRSE